MFIKIYIKFNIRIYVDFTVIQKTEKNNNQ